MYRRDAVGGVRTLGFTFLACLFLARPDLARSQVTDPAPVPAAHPSVLVDDPRTLIELEGRGFAFNDRVTPAQRAVMTRVIAEDMAEFTRDQTPQSVKRPFQTSWLTRGRFELTGVVNRFDRRAFDLPGDPTCGEVRLVYRLALRHRGRQTTRLPMTVNLRIPQRGDCKAVAARWQASRTPSSVEAILRDLPAFSKLELNFQSIHVPSYRTDMDDHAEYVLRAFTAEGDSMSPDRLFNTPRTDLADDERLELSAWLFDHVPAIDEGTAVVPERFLATRAVSVSPRGLLHLQNRPFSKLYADGSLAVHPLAGASMVKTPELFMRRLDELTCPGCHQSRGIAGFHLLGEERDPGQSFNGLAVGHSPHLGAELAWREEVLASGAQGASAKRPRPFAVRSGGPGTYGAECGLPGSGFEGWTCDAGLACRNLHGTTLGVCAPATATRAGDPCESVTSHPDDRPEGAVVASAPPDASCPSAQNVKGTAPFCAPNWLGFTGGMCSMRCAKPGETRDGDICTLLPAAGYEADCFFSREPVESCLQRHFVRARVATCDAQSPCRDDYACARVPNAAPGTGACAPPYFVFQLRVDGPVLDR